MSKPALLPARKRQQPIEQVSMTKKQLKKYVEDYPRRRVIRCTDGKVYLEYRSCRLVLLSEHEVRCLVPENPYTDKTGPWRRFEHIRNAPQGLTVSELQDRAIRCATIRRWHADGHVSVTN